MNKRIVAVCDGKGLRIEPGFCDHRRLEPMTVGGLSYNGHYLEDTTKLVYRCLDWCPLVVELTARDAAERKNGEKAG